MKQDDHVFRWVMSYLVAPLTVATLLYTLYYLYLYVQATH